jgi:iron complex outermembrane receptor protein
MGVVRVSVAIAAIGALGWHPLAFSQNQPTEVALQEVVVTAQKRTENLQDVPIAMTALSGERLEAAGINSTTDLGIVTPGLTTVNFAGFVFPHIRGVGTTAFGAGLESSIATYVDGVYIASALASLMSLNDVQQVEVLKGPQGTLFGRNATGGLIQITTKDPQSTMGGEGSIGYGNYQTASGGGYLTGGITDTLAANVAVSGSTQGQGYGTNLFNGKDVYQTDRDIAARSKWVWTPGAATVITFAGDYEEVAGTNNSTFKPAPGATQLFQFLGAVPPLPPLGTWDTDEDFQPYDTFKGGGASLRIRQDVGFAELQSLTAWRRSQYSIGFDADGYPEFLETIPVVRQIDNQVSEEVNLTSKAAGRIQWVAGLYYLYADSKDDPSSVLLGPPLQIPVPVPGLPPINQINIVGKQTTDSYAAYAQSTLALTDIDDLTLGVRYTEEHRSLTASETAYLVGGIPLGPLIPPVDESVTSGRPTWRVAYSHKFTPDVMTYVSYDRGFKSGGFNVGVPTDAPFKPETLDAYEIGLKTKTLQDRLRFNAAAYYYDYKNIQVSHFVLGQVGYYNGAAARMYGVDADMEAVLAPGLSVTAGVSLIHDYFNDFPNAVTYTPVPVFGPAGPSLLTTASATGHNLPLTPSATFNVSTDYRHELLSGEGTIDLTYYHSDGYAFAPDNILRQGAVNILNASLSWSTPREGFTVSFWGKNLTNETIANALLSSSIGSLASYRPPRTYGITLGTKF